MKDVSRGEDQKFQPVLVNKRNHWGIFQEFPDCLFEQTREQIDLVRIYLITDVGL